jgi:hypothetical protein
MLASAVMPATATLVFQETDEEEANVNGECISELEGKNMLANLT